MSEEDKERAKEEAAAQYRSIVEMVTALNLDWEWLEELEDQENLDPEDVEKLHRLREEAGDYKSREDVEQRIREDPLSVEVRSDWVSAGEPFEPTDFRILLCWGGPSVQIRGELDEYNQPSRAWIEYQDWFTGWTQYFDTEQDTLLEYCRQFYFGG